MTAGPGNTGWPLWKTRLRPISSVGIAGTGSVPQARLDLTPKMGEIESPKLHALHVPVSRRAEGPPSGVGSRRPAREARARGPRVQGPVAGQQGEDAVL